jgi:hypothetical protein
MRGVEMAKKIKKQPALKPQDLLLVLKLCANEHSQSMPYSELARSIGLTASETHAAVERAEMAALLRQDMFGRHPIKRNILEFVVHGAKYAFPAARGRVSRGVPTSLGVEPLSSLIAHAPDEIPVWPSASGKMRGPSIIPLYPSVVGAAEKDAALYQLLALFDALREGRARERDLAKKLITERIR